MRSWAVVVLAMGLSLAGWARAADELVSGVQIEDSGRLQIGGVVLDVLHYNSSWTGATQSQDLKADEGFPKRTGDSWEVRGKMAVRGPDSPFDFHQVIRATDKTTLTYEVDLASEAAIQSNSLVLSVNLPVAGYAGRDIAVDEEGVKLPPAFGDLTVLRREGVRSVQIPTDAGRLTIEGPLTLYVQDNRQFKGDNFDARISFKPGDGLIKKASLRLTLRLAADAKGVKFARRAGGVPSGASELLPGMSVEANGRLNVGGVPFSLLHFGPGWAASAQTSEFKTDDGYPKQEDNAWEVQGKFAVKSAGSPFAVREVIKTLDDQHSISYEVSVQGQTAIQTNSLTLSGTLPCDRYAGSQITVDGEAVQLPPALVNQGVFSKQGAQKLEIAGTAGRVVIEGPVAVYVQDDRQWGGSDFSLRLNFTPADGAIQQASLKLTFRHTPYETAVIDIAGQANMAWADETAGDRQGGWTDQGPDNDLRMLEAGTRAVGPVTFRILDPAENAGKACIVLGSSGDGGASFPASVTIPLGENAKPFRYLYLLHASAWTPAAQQPVGSIGVTYADGTESEAQVLAARDVGNWWAATSVPNGAVAWTAENKSSFVGLYLTHSEVQPKPIRSIRLTASGKGAWMIAAMSSSQDLLPNPTEAPTYIVANDQWKPIEFTHEVEAGSVLDFSNLLDAPAGKYGHVVVRGPHFEFADRPGERVRFYGCNLCFSANFPTHEEAEKIAERIGRIGYNVVRMHHYDGDVIDKNKKEDSVTLDPQQIDRMDYLVSCFKKRGIYVNIDLYTFRTTRANEIPEIGRPVQGDYKAVVALLDSGMANWQAFARSMMTHKNPYTGMTWAEDPVLMGICPLNEDPLTVTYNSSPEIAAICQKRFEQWLKQQNHTPKDDKDRAALMSRFLMEVQLDCVHKTFAFLKSLGVQAPLTSVNVVDAMCLTPIRAEQEYVDDHAYWDHPGFPEKEWSMPFSHHQKSDLAAGAEVPRGMFPSRIIGKPFTVTEFNYVMPNRYRAEGGPLIGAYAALQDWDGLFRFALSHSIDNLRNVGPAGGFDLSNEPLSLLSERIGILFFTRGDVAAAKGMVPYLVTADTANTGQLGWGADPFPWQFSYLGLHTRIGSISADTRPQPLEAFTAVSGSPRLPESAYGKSRFVAADDSLMANLASANVIPADAVDTKAKRAVSDTGQIRLDGTAGTLQVVTGRSECFVMRDNGALQGQTVSVASEGGTHVLCVAAMDGKPLAQSGRLLVLHLTDVQNTKIRFRNKAMNLLERTGQLPHLVRAGKVQVSLKLEGDRPVQAWALDLSGHRREAVDVRRGNGSLSFTADTARPGGSCMAYELVRP